MKLDYVILDHSIKSKDPFGRILAEIIFTETAPGVFNIESTYVSDRCFGEGIEDELVSLAVERIHAQHGKITATCPYARKWLHERHMDA